MAGIGTNKTSGISTDTTLFGWDYFYSPTNYIVQGKSGQSAIYGSPYWFEKIYGAGNDTIYAGGFYSTSAYNAGAGTNAITVGAYTTNYVNGGTGSNWISFASFTNLASDTSAQKISTPSTAWNNYVDYGNAINSLISGKGFADRIDGTPGVVVNLSGVSLVNALKPLIRVDTPADGKIQNYGLVSGLSDYLTSRLYAVNALDGQNGVNLFSSTDGLGARQYAFYADGTKYAIGDLANIQNVQGSKDASNVIVGGAANGMLQGGFKDDIIVGGTGNNSLYGGGGHDLLISTVGNDTMYAAQVGHLGTTTPKAAVLSGTDASKAGSVTMIAGTGVVTMVGSDASNDYFVVGSNNETIYGSGLGANGTSVDVGDYDTLSFAQIGTTYFKGYKNLTITINYVDSKHQTGTAVATYQKADGSYATLFNDKFFDIEHIVFGSTKMVFKDPANPNGYYPTDPIDPGFTGGDPGNLNNTSGLIDPGPATSSVTGNNPNGGNTVNGGGGGNTNLDGGGNGNNPNTLNFSSNADGTYYDCEDQLGKTGNVRNFSLVLDLIGQKYSYQQDINGTPTVYGGTVKNFQIVTGTVDCSDILVGKSDTISLTGGGGEHNIIYAGGGHTGSVATTLTGSRNDGSNGGDGHNWVVFQNPTDLINGGSGSNNGAGRSGSGVAYSNGVTANLDPYYEFDGYRGVMSGFANVLGTAGADTITGDKNDNILVGGGGNDTIAGGSSADGGQWGGNDTLYGGAGSNRVTGGALSGNTDTFVVGYDYNPVAAGAYATNGSYGPLTPSSASLGNHSGDITAEDLNSSLPDALKTVGVVTTTSGTDLITDWKNSDGLFVSRQGAAIIDGINTSSASAYTSMRLADEIAGTTYTLDFRTAQNLGTITVSAGNGNNTVYGSSGIDYITLGNGNNTVDDTASIDSWNRALTETQTIVVGNGNNTITVGSGVYEIYAGAGLNTITLGANDGNRDNIYIYNYTTQDNIKNFEHGIDKIYFDRTMLRNMGLTEANQAIADNGSPILGLHTTSNDALQNGQDYRTGNIGILSGLYDAVYRAALGGLGADNGAWNNNEYRLAYTAGVAANSAVITVDLALASGLSAIPIVGPIIAIPFYVLAGLMIYDTVGTKSYENRVYNTNPTNQPQVGQSDNPLLGFANNMKVDNTGVTTTDGNWTSAKFMDFYQYSTSGGFKPSLEITNGYDSLVEYPIWYDQTAWTTRNTATGTAGVNGIRTIALLHGNGATYVYVINSSDNLIQNNEARLFAKVNGYLTPDDLALFDASTDSHLNFTPGAAPIPPAFSSLAFAAGGGKSANIDPNNSRLIHTNASSGTLAFTFLESLIGNTLALTDNAGNAVAGGVLSNSNKTVTYNLGSISGGAHMYTITVSTPAGFEASTSVVLDVIAPPTNTADHTDVQVSATTQGIVVSSRVAAEFIVRNDAGTPAKLSLDTNPSSANATSGAIAVGQGGSVTLVPAAQGSQAWVGSFLFDDGLGDTNAILVGQQPYQQLDSNNHPIPGSYDTIPYIGLGTLGGDAFDASATGKGYSNANTVVYGFGGNDIITANATTNFSTTFIAGNDANIDTGGTNSHLNVITANASGGNLILDLTGSLLHVDTVKIADGAAGIHAASGGNDASIAMSISGFKFDQDMLIFTGDTATALASGTSTTSGLTLTATNGIVAFSGSGIPVALKDLITATESFLGTTEGKVAAFDYQYATTTDIYDTDATSATYGQKTGTTTVQHHDLVVIHVEGGSDYSVVQLVDISPTAISGLSLDPSTHAITLLHV